MSEQPRNRVLCVAKWYGAKYALGAEDRTASDGDFKFLRFLFPLCGPPRPRRQRVESAHFGPVTFFNCFIIYGRGGTLVIDPSLPLPLALFPPAVLRPRGKISIWLLTYKMSWGSHLDFTELIKLTYEWQSGLEGISLFATTLMMMPDLAEPVPLTQLRADPF